MADRPELRRNPNFHRLWGARVVSRFGSALGYVVLLWLTYSATGSGLAVAYVGLAEFVPTVVVGLWTGALVDRFDRRRVIVVSTLARSGAMAALVGALEIAGFRLPIVVTAAAVFTVCSTFFGPASQALLPEIVPRSALASANGLFDATESAVAIAGSAAAGGLILAVGAVPSLGVDAVAYLAGALLIAAIAVPTARHSAPPLGAGEGLLAEVRAGLAYLRARTGLFELTLASAALNFFFSLVLTFLVVYSARSLHGGALVYGGLEACLTAGAGIGSLATGRLGLARRAGRVWAAGAAAQGLGVVVLVARPDAPVALPVVLAIGVVQGAVNVALLTTVQAIVPARMQGRYFATDTALGYAAIPAAQIAGGVLIATAGIGVTFLVAGIGSLVTAAAMVSRRELLAVGYDARVPPAVP